MFLYRKSPREDTHFIDVSDIEERSLVVARDAIDGTLLCGGEQAFRAIASEIDSAFAEQGEGIRRRQRELIDRIDEEGVA